LADGEGLILNRETIPIEGDRNLYNYTFREATPEDRLAQMIEGRQVGVIGAFLDQHPDLDLTAAIELARKLDNQEAVNELTNRR
jgi:hypothetical protein